MYNFYLQRYQLKHPRLRGGGGALRLYKQKYSPPFLAHLGKGHVSFCHHLASVVVRPSVVRRKLPFNSSPLKPLNQIKPNLAGMVPGWVSFKIGFDSPALHSRWLLLLKIEISSNFHCCFILNQNELKFSLQLHGNEQFNIYSVFFCEIFFQPIYTDYANQAYFDKRSHLNLLL